MPNVMTAQQHIGGALCESSVIPFLVPRCKVWLTLLLECCAVTLPIQVNARPWSKMNFALGKIASGDKSPRKCIYSVPAQETAKHCAKFAWPPVSDVCSNEGKTRNPLKFAGVPQTPEQIWVTSGPKFTILWGHMEEILLLNKLFRLLIHAFVAKIQPDKVVWWCAGGDFLRPFCILHFQRAACSTFQNCILNLH